MPAQTNPKTTRRDFARQVADRETAHLREAKDEAHEQYFKAKKLFDTAYHLSYFRVYDGLL
jgi:hypothetical protein